ncbi:hypothetical protein GJ496_005041 [Pomphorhynchus laevis]|nr:hypothetical protein GJ496_005041 [Pomphorhynchus laevis]
MINLKHIVDTGSQSIQAVAIDRHWLLATVDSNTPSSTDCELLLYNLDFRQTNSLDTADLNTTLKSDKDDRNTSYFIKQPNFYKKSIKQIYSLPRRISFLESDDYPPDLLICLSVDGKVLIFEWIVNEQNDDGKPGKYQTLKSFNSYKLFYYVHCMTLSYCTNATRALAFASKKYLYPLYWTADSDGKLSPPFFISAIPPSPSATNVDGFAYVKFPENIKDICWSGEIDRIYVSSQKDYYCLILCKDVVEVCPFLKSEHYTIPPSFSKITSILSQKTWNTFAFYTSQKSVHLHCCCQSDNSEHDYQHNSSMEMHEIQVDWANTRLSQPTMMILSNALLICGFQQDKTIYLESRLAVVNKSRSDASNGYLFNTLTIDNSGQLSCVNVEQQHDSSLFKTQNVILVLYNATTVWMLVKTDPFDSIQELLDNHMYSTALSICEYMTSSGNGSSLTGERSLDVDEDDKKDIRNKIRRVRTLQAIHDFKEKKKYTESVRNFLELNVECSNVLRVLCPCLLSNRRQSTKKIIQQLQSTFDPKAIDEIIIYLTERRVKLLARLLNKGDASFISDATKSVFIVNELKIIENALLHCYVAVRPSMISILVRSLHYCDNFEEVYALLRSLERLDDLLVFCKQRSKHKEALQIIHEQVSDGKCLLNSIVKYCFSIFSHNVDLVLDQLSSLNHQNATSELTSCASRSTIVDNEITNPIASVLCDYDFKCLTIFMEAENARSIDYEKILTFIKRNSCNKELMFICYLENVIYNWNSNDKQLQFDLAKTYINHADKLRALKNINTEHWTLREKLSKLINRSTDLDKLLPLLENHKEEKALLLFTLKMYDPAFSILIDDLRLHEKAINLVVSNENIMDSTPTQVNRNSIKSLISTLISTKEISSISQLSGIDLVLKLLNDSSLVNYIDVNLLDQLPNHVPLYGVSEFLTCLLVKNEHMKQECRLKRCLLETRAKKLNQLVKRLENVRFDIDETSMCSECKRRLHNSAIARYPNGTVVHLGCMTSQTTKSNKLNF